MIDQDATNRRWSSNVASSQHDRSGRAALLKVIYPLIATAVTFVLPPLFATGPLRWFIVSLLLALRILTLLVCRVPVRQIVRPAWRLEWLFLFLIGCYALLPPESPAEDLVLHWRVPGLQWLFPFNVTGLDHAAVMCLQILTVLLASAMVRLTGKGDDLVRGLQELKLPGLFVHSLDRTLSLLSGAYEPTGRRRPDAGAQRGTFAAVRRLLRGDVDGFVQLIKANIALAGRPGGRARVRNPTGARRCHRERHCPLHGIFQDARAMTASAPVPSATMTLVLRNCERSCSPILRPRSPIFV